MEPSDLERGSRATRRALLASYDPRGAFLGELSASALSTSVALTALHFAATQRPDDPFAKEHRRLVRGARDWLLRHANPDGGFGDTPQSPSNLSTTTLAWVALGLAVGTASGDPVLTGVEHWLERELGSVEPEKVAARILAAYGEDRTFSIPILTMCALGGRLGAEPWKHVLALPFELAACPHAWFRWIGLPMVSYALPALIAMGQVHHHHDPTWFLPWRLLRNALRGRTLRVARDMQPESGGYLEAAPLTAFVCMSLLSSASADHAIVRDGLRFLRETVRADGSWPIDTNLDTWTTTLAVNALAAGRGTAEDLEPEHAEAILDWLLDQQATTVHPFTRAAPGGWAWTDRSGGVPDADDTPGAILALKHLEALVPEARRTKLRAAAARGIEWTLKLQNRDGGIPTFCKGWGKLPFDASCPDLTAHVLRAWHAWSPQVRTARARRIAKASERAIAYLIRAQFTDGAWLPLWFGNQHSSGQRSPLYGTSRVLLAAAGIECRKKADEWCRARDRARDWLLSIQGEDGGFGGDRGVPASVEETALALEALAALDDRRCDSALERALEWWARATAEGTRFPSTPIGLYFARLWYSDRLYPVLFSTAALQRLRSRPSQRSPQEALAR